VRLTRKLVVLTGAIALAVPSAALATPGNGNAFGKNCQGVSKQHVDGQKGTPFSQCVQDGGQPVGNPT
jgi:hypothetical protein